MSNYIYSASPKSIATYLQHIKYMMNEFPVTCTQYEQIKFLQDFSEDHWEPRTHSLNQGHRQYGSLTTWLLVLFEACFI